MTEGAKEVLAAAIRGMPRPTVVLDLDGTITRSLRRRYQCYCEALRIFGQRVWDPTQKRRREQDGRRTKRELEPISCEEFERRYPTLENVSQLLDFIPATGRNDVEDLLAQWFSNLFGDQLKKYTDEQLSHDVVPPENLAALREILAITSSSVVSFRHMDRRRMLQQLRSLGLVNCDGVDGMFNDGDINVVGVDGMSSRRAKLIYIRQHYHPFIEAMKALGVPVVIVGDSEKDFEVAAELGAQFVSITTGGETCELRFRQAFDKARAQGFSFPEPECFTSLGDPACITYFKKVALEYARARQALLAEVSS